jgi:hypothetical protein
MARRDEPRLDQPKSPRSLVLRPHYDPDAFGRFSETIARFIGTARFLVLMTIFVVVWVTFNVVLDVAYSRDPEYRACAAQRRLRSRPARRQGSARGASRSTPTRSSC